MFACVRDEPPLFRKLEIPCQKFLEEVPSNEVLECHSSSLFYGDEYSPSNNPRKYGLDPKQINDAEVQPCYKNAGVERIPTDSYGFDSKIIERFPATPTAETELLPLVSKPPGLPRFESKLNKTNTANRKKVFISSEKNLN